MTVKFLQFIPLYPEDMAVLPFKYFSIIFLQEVLNRFDK